MLSCKANKCFLTDISDTKFNGSILNIEVAIEGYDLIRLDLRAVTCFSKGSVAYCHKMAQTRKAFHRDIPTKFQTIYRVLFIQLQTTHFVNYIDQIFCEFNTLVPQECYLIISINIKLLSQGKEIVSNKFAKIALKRMLPLIKQYLRALLFTFFKKTNHVTYFLHRQNQWTVTNLGLSDHCPIFCTSEILKLKFHKHNKICTRSTKHNKKENG